ncbi:apolipoprotein N-acyltransferase [Orrella daihaiensis]|uniref:Apolipoprotein N-acyltransferase n=1 Tax=Orrella daihaiensis TaxID=2782176 RepID=A0ABY4AN96_9BURK|nr:apolipoprotein N-acyltransferase [Orrella daihaiensis]UOD51101.1 apolipoprotein N-acyltransferase [Orrella daihaiensis]
MQARTNLFWPALFGGVYALTFAPGPLPAWSLAWTQIVMLAVLAHWAFSQPPRRAAITGMIFGAVQFLTGLYWLTISMHVYGQLALPLAWLALLLFSAYLALYPAFAGWVCAWLLKDSNQTKPSSLIWLATVWASAWTAAELLRGFIFTGFPWLSTAYGQTDSWLAGWAVIVGAPGTTWVIAWIAGAVAATLRAEATQNDSSFTPKRGIALAVAILLVFIGASLQQTSFTKPTGEPLTVRLIQGNVDQGVKFDAMRFEQTHQHHIELARHQSAPAADTPAPELIMLPETVIPRLSHQVPARHWQDWIAIADSNGSTLMLGAPLYGPESDRYTNSVIAIDANSAPANLSQGLADARYDKQHLVPFGEFVPTGFRWFIDLMRIPLGDFTAGNEQQTPFSVRSQRIAPNICYEDIFGQELLPAVRQGATILANFSNLGWFGDSSALRQHWQMARFRSMETRRPTLRATNTGMTGAIDPAGRTIAVLPTMAAGYVDVQVQGHEGLTPYARWGNYPAWVLAWGILVVALVRRRRSSARPD